jgi:nucleotide-binding universal stress UspA family protein
MYNRILVAVDGSNPSNVALKEAIKLAKGKRAILRLVHVVDISSVYLSGGMPSFIGDYEKTMSEAGRKELGKWAARAKAAGVKSDTKLVVALTQSIGDVINKEAKRWSANLIVIGTHGRRGFNHLLLGSVAERVIRLAKKPVLVVHGH